MLLCGPFCQGDCSRPAGNSLNEEKKDFLTNIPTVAGYPRNDFLHDPSYLHEYINEFEGTPAFNR